MINLYALLLGTLTFLGGFMLAEISPYFVDGRKKSCYFFLLRRHSDAVLTDVLEMPTQSKRKRERLQSLSSADNHNIIGILDHCKFFLSVTICWVLSWGRNFQDVVLFFLFSISDRYLNHLSVVTHHGQSPIILGSWFVLHKLHCLGGVFWAR